MVTHENERVKEFGQSDNFWLKLLPHFIKIHSAYLLTPFIPVVGRVADTNCRVNIIQQIRVNKTCQAT